MGENDKSEESNNNSSNQDVKEIWPAMNPTLRSNITYQDLCSISGEKMLTSSSIYIFMEMLKRQHPNVRGLQDTLLAEKAAFKSLPNSEFVQILHDGKHHWVAVSTHGCKPGEIIYMDKLKTMSSDNDNSIADSEEVETEEGGFSSSADSSNFFNYFKTASLKASLVRHAKDNHRNDRAYNYQKSIFPEWHKEAVAAKREKEAGKAKRSKLSEHNASQEAKDLEPSATESNTASAFNVTPDECDGKDNETNDAAYENSIGEDMGSTESLGLNDFQQTVPKVQSVIGFQPVANNPSLKESKSNDDVSEIKELLHVMLEKMEISKEEEKVHPVSESAQAINILKQSYCLVDIDGSCFQFFPGEFDGGIVRCNTCFAMICEKNPALIGKDPTHTAMRQIESVAGNNFAAGLSLSKERTELLISGGNQSWYSFKNMMIEHQGRRL
eukprot:gene11416-12606_t